MAPAYIEIATDDSADDTTQLSSELLSDNDVEENATNDVKSSPLKRYLNSQKRGYDSGSESDNQSVTSVPKMLDFAKSQLARASQSSMTGIGPKRKKPTDFTFNFGSQIKTKNRESQQPSMSNEYEQISKKNTETIEVPLDTWANKSAPKKLEELCIHNRKISDLENEIRSLIYRKDETRILVVSGPTGSGKSTACKMIALF
jgi:flagellar biosynthesis GTPase FlhF